MELTTSQAEIWQHIKSAIAGATPCQIVYCSEWLGYLPFGVYHWIEAHGQTISNDFPSGWQQSDLDTLEQAGLLRKVAEWRDPEDDYHQKITYDVVGA